MADLSPEIQVWLMAILSQGHDHRCEMYYTAYTPKRGKWVVRLLDCWGPYYDPTTEEVAEGRGNKLDTAIRRVNVAFAKWQRKLKRERKAIGFKD